MIKLKGTHKYQESIIRILINQQFGLSAYKYVKLELVNPLLKMIDESDNGSTWMRWGASLIYQRNNHRRVWLQKNEMISSVFDTSWRLVKIPTIQLWAPYNTLNFGPHQRSRHMNHHGSLHHISIYRARVYHSIWITFDPTFHGLLPGNVYSWIPTLDMGVNH
jgi:hypothetical protein